MKTDKLIELWQEEEARTFEGWDFGYLKDRMIDSPLPWDYKSMVKEYLKPEYQLLDMGTGGGEFLLSLDHPYTKTSVTEAYPPNIQLCYKKLQPLGIKVHGVKSNDQLPINNRAMDMVINRHESFDVKEVDRMLKPGGIFISQQVGSWNNWDLSKALVGDISARQPSDNIYSEMVAQLEESFEIFLAKESFPKLKFMDLGALVYFAKVIEWEFPNFSVEANKDQLLKLQDELESIGYIESTEHRYIIGARKK